ncbi:MAG: hypothetical protein ACI9NC_002673 [Verrucomicrobiales bacterium]|jgi:hypothetical protein
MWGLNSSANSIDFRLAIAPLGEVCGSMGESDLLWLEGRGGLHRIDLQAVGLPVCLDAELEMLLPELRACSEIPWTYLLALEPPTCVGVSSE